MKHLNRVFIFTLFPFLVGITTLLTPAKLSAEEDEHIVVIDPGHGGADNKRLDDKWDVLTGGYLDYYNTGMTYHEWKEYQVVMDLARRVEYYLTLPETDEGWERFSNLIKQFDPGAVPRRARWKILMARTYNWEDKFSDPFEKNVNDDFRLYDYPEDEEHPDKGMRDGRISFINQQKPELVVSLHLNPAGYGNPGGMTAVLTPGYRTFDLIRHIHLDKEPISRFESLPWATDGNWLITDDGWSRYQAARADTWVYFNGFRTTKNGKAADLSKNRGLRYNMFRWRYADSAEWVEIAKKQEPGPYTRNFADFQPTGKYWDRERGQAELWRREDGIPGFGGDNHYAADEIMKFVQYGVRKLAPSLNHKYSVGPIQKPYVSAYTLPNYVNAISAYIEIGHLNRKRDRITLIDHGEQVAQSIAVGIYSLFYGLKVHRDKIRTPYMPRGTALDFAKYRNMKEGNYFKMVVEQ